MTMIATILCARCAHDNPSMERFCEACGLPLGALQPDAGAGRDALGAYEDPEPADPDVARLADEFARRAGFQAGPYGQGWRLIVPLRHGRKQAVYVGPAGIDADGQAVVGLVSVCGPVHERDCRALLKLNARIDEGHFAIRVLRGEEYFVVVENVPGALLAATDAPGLVRRVAQLADGLEERLSRGGDLY